MARRIITLCGKQLPRSPFDVLRLSLTISLVLVLVPSALATNSAFGFRAEDDDEQPFRSLRWPSEADAAAGWGADEDRHMGADGLLSLDYLRDAATPQHYHNHSHSFHGRLLARADSLFATAFCKLRPDPPVTRGNLFSVRGSETGARAWQAFGDTSIALVDRRGIGRPVVVASRRGQTYAGPAQFLRDVKAAQYELIVWVKLSPGAENQLVRATAKYKGDDGDDEFTCLGSAVAKSHCWTKLMGGFTLYRKKKEVSIFLEGPKTDVEIWATSATLLEVDSRVWRREQNQRIKKLRTRPVSIRVVAKGRDRRGKRRSVRGARVEIKQTRSDFPFGAGTNGGILFDRKYREWFTARFTWAVYNNEDKWYFTEPEKGKVNYSIPDAMTKYFKRMGIQVRAHNLFWEVQQYVQQWVQDLDDEDLFKAMQRRVMTAVARYRGKASHWDVLNEPLHGNFFESRLGKRILSWMFKAARKFDPKAKLFINDYNTIETCSDKSHPELYLAEVWGMSILNGAPVGGIGVEAHFNSEPQPVRIRHDLNQLSVANVPIWITELDFGSDGKMDTRTQAKYFEVAMRELFAHPAVKGIVMWTPARVSCSKFKDIDPNMCKKCNTCWTDENFNDNELGKTYVKLRKEWSTRLRRRLSGWGRNGNRIAFRGFHGNYKAQIRLANGESKTVRFRVPRGKGANARKLLRITLVV